MIDMYIERSKFVQTKRFDFATVFSVIHGRELSREVLPIIEFMTGKKFTKDKIVDGMTLCRPKLIETFPSLVIITLNDLDNEIDKCDVNSCVNQITTNWLKRQELSCHYKFFDVPRIENPKPGYEKFLILKSKLGY